MPPEHELGCWRWLPFLAKQLPLPIPEPVAKGAPSPGVFPRIWSVYGWLEGEVAGTRRPADLVAFAVDVAAFLDALYRVDATGGPGARRCGPEQPACA